MADDLTDELLLEVVMSLRALTGLEDLNLKGTKFTDAGVEELQKVLPAVKVQR